MTTTRNADIIKAYIKYPRFGVKGNTPCVLNSPWVRIKGKKTLVTATLAKQGPIAYRWNSGTHNGDDS